MRINHAEGHDVYPHRRILGAVPQLLIPGGSGMKWSTSIGCLMLSGLSLLAPVGVGKAMASVIPLTWDAAPPDQYIVAWRVYRRDAGGAWAYLKRVTTPRTNVEFVVGRCWRVTAVNALGQVSAPSLPYCGV